MEEDIDEEWERCPMGLPHLTTSLSPPWGQLLSTVSGLSQGLDEHESVIPRPNQFDPAWLKAGRHLGEGRRP